MRLDSPEIVDHAEDLLAELDWLRGLVRALVGRGDDADELVQEAALLTLEHPPARGRGLRAWLRRVTTNRLAGRARSERRRIARERVSASAEAQPATDEVCARLECQHVVVEEALALPTIYREAITLRFLEELPPRQIAARLDISVETVKSRIQRGLALLRERLEARLGSGGAWHAVLMPLLMPPVGKFISASPIPLLATLAMKTKLLVVLALLAILIPVLIWNLGDAPSRQAEGGFAASVAPAADTSDAEDTEVLRNVPDEDASGSPFADTSAPASDSRRVLRLQVVDRRGQPLAGVPLAIVLIDALQRKLLWKGVSEGPQAIVHVDELPTWEADGQEVNAFIDVRVLAPPHATLQPGVIPAEPIQLVMPPCGDLVLEFKHASGEVLSIPSKARIEPLEWPPRITPLRGSLMAGGRGTLFAMENGMVASPEGRMHFPRVGLGLRLKVTGSHTCLWETRPFEYVVDGPREDAETAEREILVELPFVRARFLDASGEPLRETPLVLWSEGNTGAALDNRITVRTDADGILRIPGGWKVGHAGTRYLIATQTIRSYVRRPPRSLFSHGPSVRVPLTHAGEMRVIDLGDRMLESLPLLARGRVVDAAGASVPGVTIVRERPGPEHLRATRWLPYPSCAQSDAQGRFVLRGFLRGEELRLRTVKDGLTDTWMTTGEGLPEELVLEVGRASAIEGRILVDEGVPLKRLRLQLRGERFHEHVQLAPSGHFRIENLSAGRYTMEVHLGSDEIGLLCSEVLELRAGEILRDPRLDPLDLRDRLRLLDLQLETAAGETLPGRLLAWKAAGTDQSSVYSGSDRKGLARLLLPVELDMIQVRMRGCRAKRIATRPSPQRLVLQPVLGFEVELSQAASLLRPPVTLELHLIPLDEPQALRPFYKRHFGENRRVRFELDAPGRYRAEWVLVRGIQLIPQPAVRLRASQVITIKETTAGQILRLAPPLNALEQARGELEKQRDDR